MRKRNWAATTTVLSLLLRTADLPVTGVSQLDRLYWDRAYLKWSLPAADLTAGKQRIAWGAGYLWNPTDVFNPFTLSFAVQEDQEAAPTALRLEVPYGALGELFGCGARVEAARISPAGASSSIPPTRATFFPMSTSAWRRC